jgi:hypothetical protein
VQRLRELGWIENRTVAIEYRWAEGRDERFAQIAAEFVRLKVDVILTYGTQGKTYTHGHRLLRAPRARSRLLPDGYTGRLNKDSIFKICSDDQRISCFLRFHDAATPLPRGWISEPFPLEGQQMAPGGPRRRKKGRTPVASKALPMSRIRPRIETRTGTGGALVATSCAADTVILVDLDDLTAHPARKCPVAYAPDWPWSARLWIPVGQITARRMASALPASTLM